VVDTSYLNDLFDIVEQERFRQAFARNEPSLGVTEEEKQEALRWHMGREFQNVEEDSGCAMLLDKLRGFAERDINHYVDMIKVSPMEVDRIRDAHIDAYSSSRVYNWLRREIQLDKEAAETVPQVIKEGYRLTKGTPAGPADE
jgi:hypothetical protein